MSSAKWRQFCLGLNVLMNLFQQKTLSVFHFQEAAVSRNAGPRPGRVCRGDRFDAKLREPRGQYGVVRVSRRRFPRTKGQHRVWVRR